MPIKLENVQITSYQIGVLDNNTRTGDDSFVFQPQGALPDTDGRDFLTWQRHTGAANSEPAVSDANLLLPAVTDPNLLLPYIDYDIA